MISDQHKHLLSSRTFPKYLFPKLIERHNEQPKTILNFYLQAHENYVYTFFYNSHMNVSKTMNINGFNGLLKSPISVSDSEFNTACLEVSNNNVTNEEEYFFSKIKYVPIPFIFVPRCRSIKDGIGVLSKGLEIFKSGKYEGILLTIDFACSLGVEFIGCDYVNREDIAVYYIGFIFKE